MQNYHKAIEYHMLHMQFAMQLEDKYVPRPCVDVMMYVCSVGTIH